MEVEGPKLRRMYPSSFEGLSLWAKKARGEIPRTGTEKGRVPCESILREGTAKVKRNPEMEKKREKRWEAWRTLSLHGEEVGMVSLITKQGARGRQTKKRANFTKQRDAYHKERA